MALDLRTIDELRRIAPTLGMSDETRAALNAVHNYALNQQTSEQRQPVNGQPMADAPPGVSLGHVGQDGENPDAFNWQLQQVEARIHAVGTRHGRQLSQHQQPFQQPAANQQPRMNQQSLGNQQPFMNEQLRDHRPRQHNHQPQDPRFSNHEGPSLLPYNQPFFQQTMRQHPMQHQPIAMQQQQPLINQQSLYQSPPQPWNSQVPGYSESSRRPYDQRFVQQPMAQQAMSQQQVQHHDARHPVGAEFQASRPQHLQPQGRARVPIFQLYQTQTPLQHRPQPQSSHAEQLEAQEQIERILNSQPASRFSGPQLR